MKQEEEQDHKSFTREWEIHPTSSEAATRKRGILAGNLF